MDDLDKKESLDSRDEVLENKRNKSFWGEVQKTQSTIEDFGYHVTTEIRKSENVVVYLATNGSDEKVAIKRITMPYSSDLAFPLSRDELEKKIRQEMDYLSKISSESGNRFVITYYDYKIVESTDKLQYDLYIRMDYLTSLQQVYDEGNLTVRDLLIIGTDICDSLEWCNQNNKVHNNINLNNIFINRNDRYMLGDFASFENQKNEVEYCSAPELLQGLKPTPQSDIYALGMVLFVLLNNGLPPFASSNSEEDIGASIKRLKSGEIPTIHRINHRLNEVIQRALCPKEKRYSSVAEFRNAIAYLEKSMPNEWLDQLLTDDSDSVLNEALSEPEKPLQKEEKQETVKLEPEEINLKKKNIKDYVLIGIVVALLIAGVVALVFTLSNSKNQKVYSLIDSGSYALAFKEIESLKSQNVEVDEFLKTYIEKCLDEEEYRRVPQAVQLFSEESYQDTDYYKSIIIRIKDAGKEKIAESVIQFLTGKNENLDEMISSLK